MDQLREHFTKISEIMDIELNELQPLGGEQLRVLKQKYTISWDPEPIYFNSTNIVFTDINDFDRINMFEQFKDPIKLEVPEFNMYIYGCRYLEKPVLNEILSQG